MGHFLLISNSMCVFLNFFRAVVHDLQLVGFLWQRPCHSACTALLLWNIQIIITETILHFATLISARMNKEKEKTMNQSKPAVRLRVLTTAWEKPRSWWWGRGKGTALKRFHRWRCDYLQLRVLLILCWALMKLFMSRSVWLKQAVFTLFLLILSQLSSDWLPL